MSDLVGNPEGRFFRVAAHTLYKFIDRVLLYRSFKDNYQVETRLNEPRREKPGLRGFRPGPTQTGLYKLRKELEA